MMRFMRYVRRETDCCIKILCKNPFEILREEQYNRKERVAELRKSGYLPCVFVFIL